jgi:DNA-binding beta-propeller fold protein YncE
MKRHFTAGAVLLFFSIAPGRAGVSMFAGTGTNGTGPAAQCRLADPFAIDFDKAGNAYICEMTNNRVVKVSARGELTAFAGTTRKGSGGDGGPAIAAEVNAPHHLLVDPEGNVLIADSWNWKIRRIDTKTGTISTFAGTGQRGYSGDGSPAAQAQFSGIYCLAADPSAGRLYLADLENRRVRSIDFKTMIVTTVAGNGQRGIPKDGSVARNAPLLDPRAVTVDQQGRVYILERGGDCMRVLEKDGTIRTVVGSGEAGPLSEAVSPLEVTLRGPKHCAVDGDGNVLIVDSENDVIRRFKPGQNRVERAFGSGKRGAALSEDPFQVQLHHPHGVNVDARGRIYVCDSYNGRVLLLEEKQKSRQ